jgi:hypothetical protein
VRIVARLFLALVAIAVIIAVAISVDWVRLTSDLEKQYAPQRKEFARALETSVQDGKNEILLKELLPAPWNLVCFVGGYNNPQKLVEKITGEESEVLKNYANGENQWSLVFFKDKNLISILRYDDSDLNLMHVDNTCGTRNSAKFKIAPFDVALSIKNYRLTDREKIPVCSVSERNNNHCSFIFLGEKYDDSYP